MVLDLVVDDTFMVFIKQDIDDSQGHIRGFIQHAIAIEMDGAFEVTLGRLTLSKQLADAFQVKSMQAVRNFDG